MQFSYEIRTLDIWHMWVIWALPVLLYLKLVSIFAWTVGSVMRVKRSKLFPKREQFDEVRCWSMHNTNAFVWLRKPTITQKKSSKSHANFSWLFIWYLVHLSDSGRCNLLRTNKTFGGLFDEWPGYLKPRKIVPFDLYFFKNLHLKKLWTFFWTSVYMTNHCESVSTGHLLTKFHNSTAWSLRDIHCQRISRLKTLPFDLDL